LPRRGSAKRSRGRAAAEELLTLSEINMSPRGTTAMAAARITECFAKHLINMG